MPPSTTLGDDDVVGDGTASLSTARGIVSSITQMSARGLDPNTRLTLAWKTVVGNRVNCQGIC